MRENCSKMKILKAMMAGCLLFNNFSGLGLIINAAAIAQSGINSVLDTNVNEEDNAVDNNTSVDDSVGGNDSEEVTPILPGDGTIEGDSNDPQKPEVDQPVEGDVPSEDEQLEVPEVEVPSEEEANSDSDTSEDSEDFSAVDEEEIALEEESQLFSLENRSAGSGLVQLWQTFPDNQPLEEGKSLSEIKKALQCQANHNLYPSGGQSEHATYVNSCYVDDALYLGEDSDYYYIYLSGYEGKVPKYQLQQNIKLDLNNDGKMVNYKVETVAYYIPGTSTYTINEEETTEILDVPELNYYDQTLDKYNDIEGKNIELYASSTVQSPSYYANENGTLIHYVTNNVTKAGSYSKVIAGKAPSWMSQGVKYYSYDGIYFYTKWRNIRVNGQGAVNQNNPFYNYYQYLPFRSKSNYADNIFNNYTNSNGGAGGKLVNTGQYFYAVQDKYGINGALQYAMGIHESGWGKSSLSSDKNNLFGMNATDNNPYGNGTSFPSVEAGINYHADYYISRGYTNVVSDWRYFGSHVGNKGSGMNVKYASDPFWGEKIAGWYYRFDKASGLKDYDYYSIGIKQSNDVYNIRSQATTSSNILYQTKNKNSNLKISNYPVLITGEQNGFYKIKTDTPIVNEQPKFNATYKWSDTFGYIDKSAINVVNNANYRDPGQGIINVPNMSGWSKEQVETWRIENGANVQYKAIDSETVSVDKVLYQSQLGEISKNIVITVTLSLGSDAALDIPNFTNFKLESVQKWAKQNSMTLKTIEKQDMKISKGNVIYQNILGKSTRRRILEVAVSTGKPETITVPNFSGWKKAEVEKWAPSNGLTVKYIEKASTTVAADVVMYQNKLGEIEKTEVVEVAISKGAQTITVPNFSGWKKTDVEKWATTNGLNVKYIEKASTTVAADVVMYQNKLGEIEKIEVVEVAISKDAQTITVPNFSGWKKAEVEKWAPSNGLTVKYIEKASTTVAADVVMYQNKLGEIEKTEVVEVAISKGAQTITVPNFSGWKKTDVEKWATTNGLNVKYIEKASTTVAADVVMYQNKLGEIEKTEVVEVAISKG